MDMPLNEVRKLTFDEFSTTKFLAHAAEQAQQRRYQDLGPQFSADRSEPHVSHDVDAVGQVGQGLHIWCAQQWLSRIGCVEPFYVEAVHIARGEISIIAEALDLGCP